MRISSLLIWSGLYMRGLSHTLRKTKDSECPYTSYTRCLSLKIINMPKWYILGWHILVAFKVMVKVLILLYFSAYISVSDISILFHWLVCIILSDYSIFDRGSFIVSLKNGSCESPIFVLPFENYVGYVRLIAFYTCLQKKLCWYL